MVMWLFVLLLYFSSSHPHLSGFVPFSWYKHQHGLIQTFYVVEEVVHSQVSTLNLTMFKERESYHGHVCMLLFEIMFPKGSRLKV